MKSEKITCVIIEDEPLSSDIMEDYIREVSFLELRAVFRDAISALDYLQNEPVDLNFIDINLPKLKGMDLIRSFHLPGQVIITTAYHEYAIEGFELGVTDYLLKPVSFDRFLKGVHRAKELFNSRRLNREPESNIYPTNDEEAIFFKSGTQLHKIDIADITYLEKTGNYFDLYTKSGRKIIIRTNFADLFEKLPAKKFFRVHKSFIVAARHIETIESNYILVNKKRIPISLSFKEAVMKTV